MHHYEEIADATTSGADVGVTPEGQAEFDIQKETTVETVERFKHVFQTPRITELMKSISKQQSIVDSFSPKSYAKKWTPPLVRFQGQRYSGGQFNQPSQHSSPNHTGWIKPSCTHWTPPIGGSKRYEISQSALETSSSDCLLQRCCMRNEGFYTLGSRFSSNGREPTCESGPKAIYSLATRYTLLLRMGLGFSHVEHHTQLQPPLFRPVDGPCPLG